MDEKWSKFFIDTADISRFDAYVTSLYDEETLFKIQKLKFGPTRQRVIRIITKILVIEFIKGSIVYSFYSSTDNLWMNVDHKFFCSEMNNNSYKVESEVEGEFIKFQYTKQTYEEIEY